MEFESLEQHELVISILQQIKKAILDLQEWNNDVVSIDGYYNNSSGMQKLAASCMLLEAIHYAKLSRMALPTNPRRQAESS